MRLRLRNILAGLLLAAMAMPAAAQTAEERTQIDWAVERGRLLFELDRAAWVGTDDLLEQVSDPAAQGLRGYVVERDAGGYVVTFYGAPADAPVAVYRGRVENRRVVSREVFAAEARPPLTALQRRLAAVRDRAATLGRRPCGDRPFNTVAIPPSAADGAVDLYLLTPQVERGRFPLGGHYRFTIAADGSVESSREFTRSCLLLGGDVPAGARPAALMATHLLDPVPTEIHVFTAMTSGLPLYVGTAEPEQRIWQVEERRIRLVERD